MDSSEAIKKVIESLVLPKYPEIKRVEVVYDSYDNRYFYRIYLGVKYKDLESIESSDKLNKDIRSVTKFVMGPNESIELIKYFDPEN